MCAITNRMSTAPVTAITTFLPMTLFQRSSSRFGAVFVSAVVSVIAALLNSLPWFPAESLLARRGVAAHPVPPHLEHPTNYGNFLIFWYGHVRGENGQNCRKSTSIAGIPAPM